jgi:FkbM family methyltransferase
VSPAIGLVGREIGRLNGVGRYRLRGSGLTVHLRHPYIDLWVLDEIFRRGTYAPPMGAAGAVRALARPIHLVDLGACAGLASAYFLTAFDVARITAFEPDEANRAILRRTFAANGLDEKSVVVAACASNTDGSVPFISDHFLSRVDPTGSSPRARMVPQLDVFPYLEDADVLKMDIQGAEWAILTDPRFDGARLTALVLEYHPYLAPDRDARAAAMSILSAAAYTLSDIVDEHAGEGTLWAWRST